jgi:D-alanyl-D-alanine carboxypeptidase
MAKMTDSEFVMNILHEMSGRSNELIADRIVRDLGKRIRQRARDRARDSEDVNQAAARIVREATKE